MSETLIKNFIVLCWCGILHFSSMEKPFLAIKLIIYNYILVDIAISYIITRVSVQSYYFTFGRFEIGNPAETTRWSFRMYRMILVTAEWYIKCCDFTENRLNHWELAGWVYNLCFKHVLSAVKISSHLIGWYYFFCSSVVDISRKKTKPKKVTMELCY